MESVLDRLVQTLDLFDAAFERRSARRQSQVAASAELRAPADEIVQIVRVMDGLNRYRFMGDPALLAARESASNVVATPRSEVPGYRKTFFSTRKASLPRIPLALTKPTPGQ